MDPPRKSHIGYKFPAPALGLLHGLVAQTTRDNLEKFKNVYGDILAMLYTVNVVEERGIHTLLQFYDPPLRCFTFPDYQIAPTLEEFSFILGIPIKNEVPFHIAMPEPEHHQIAAALYLSKEDVKDNLAKKGGLTGFHLKFLVDKAAAFAEAKNWVPFNAILALCMYGIVFFPVIENFVDMNAIHIYILRNPVPTLLGDFYYSVHTRNQKKKGVVMCCVPLIWKWFASHLPRTDAFMDPKSPLKWSQKLMGHTAQNIVWFDKNLSGIDIICSCGEFENVPLIGVRGGINYNPVLLIRQFAYGTRKPPSEKEVDESLFFDAKEEPELLQRAVRAWQNIRRKGKSTFGIESCRTYLPYKEWLDKRLETFIFPFPKMAPLYPQFPEQPATIRIEEYNKLEAIVNELRDENLDLTN